MTAKQPSNNYNDSRRGQPPPIEFLQLKGHSGSVLCLDHSNSASNNRFGDANSADSVTGNIVYDSTLLSGSEDGTCRLWDLRTGFRASLCIRCRNDQGKTAATMKTTPFTDASSGCDVLSVSFGPSWQHQISADNANVEASPFARDYTVYAAVGSNVYGYDLRYATSPIITIPSFDYSFLDCTDDINQISFSPLVATTARVQQQSDDICRLVLFATADDSGTVRVADSKQRKIYTHDSTALVTSIAYRPQHQQQLYNSKNKKQPTVILASGGTDCCIKLWDGGDCCHLLNDTTAAASKASTLPLTAISIPQVSSSESNQVCNPPMVHCLQWSPSGQLLAAGLGDGSVAIMHHTKATTASLILTSRIEDAHSGTVASCLFPAWIKQYGISNAITANDRLMCTTGNDGNIAFWDLGESIGDEKANNPAKLFPLSNDVVPPDTSQPKATDDDIVVVPRTLFAFHHRAGKPNWMIHSGTNDTSFPHSLFVADTSNNITVYTIPIR